MGRSLSPLLRQELANLDKDADTRRSAMKALKSYAKDLDSKAIPHFLAEVSDPKKSPGSSSSSSSSSSSGECTISLYEVLARVHGRNIVPQTGNIMSTIMRTLSSSGGSFALHQACSRVVPAIARYGIDPSTPDEEKARIIRSLCGPLCDALMGPQESAAAGAALCLRALVESGNWRFAPDEAVNEVCLKAAGAMEEKATQTNAHMGLVMALGKHNSLIAEAYARSLVRSGLRILSGDGAAESNSQKRLSAIQMINFLMKCVDPRSISSELDRVVNVMEMCQSDRMPFVRGAAFEALQTAKAIATQRRTDASPWRAQKNSSAAAQFASPESQTVDSCITCDVLNDSPVSIGQSSCNFEYARRTNRRLWSNEGGGVDVSLKDGLFLKACSDNGELSDMSKEHSAEFSGFVHAKPMRSIAGEATTPSPQRSRSHLAMDDVKIYTSPRKLIRSLQNSPIPSNGVPERPHNRSVMGVTGDSLSKNFNFEVEGERNFEKMGSLGKQNSTEDAEVVPDGTESVSSTGDVPENNAHKAPCGAAFKHVDGGSMKKNRIRYDKAALSFVLGLALILLAALCSAMRSDNDERVFHLVPT